MVGRSTEKGGSKRSPDTTKNTGMGAVTSQNALEGETISLLVGKNKEENCIDLFISRKRDTVSEVAASSVKELGAAPMPCETGDLTVLDRMKKNKRKRGNKTRNADKRSPDTTKNTKTGLQEKDKGAVMSQDALERETVSLLVGKSKEEKCNVLFISCKRDTVSEVAASSPKELALVLMPCETGEKANKRKRGKKNNKRNRGKKKNLNADMELGREDSEHLRIAGQTSQIAAAGVDKEEKCNDVLTFREGNTASKASLKKLGSVPQLSEEGNSTLLEEFEESKRKRKKKKSLKAERQQLGPEDANHLSTAFGETFDNILTTHTMESCQKSCAEMKSKKRKRRHSVEMTEKACNEAASSFYQSKHKSIANGDFKAGTSLDSSKKGWLSAQMELLDKGVIGDERHHAGALKVRYPLRNLKDLFIILDLNGVLIKRWDVNPSLPGVFKSNKWWIQLRPGCIEFLCKAFLNFKVGIWSTMTEKNVLDVCKFLEQQAHQHLPFFMLWSKDSCFQLKGVQRPDKSHVLADFKPLSHVWRFFEPYLGPHNTVLVDDSPYKACMNNPYNCIFPDEYDGCTDDNFLSNVLWPHLDKMRMVQNIQAYIANNPLGQQPIVVGHKLYYHVRRVMEVFVN